MGRQPCCEKVGLKRGPWTIEEDNKLMNFIVNNGIHCWRMVPKLAGLLRCGKSCRLRWINYLRPDLKRGAFSEFEEDQMIQLHARLGNRWSKIAAHFAGRTDNEIKNHWNTRIKKRLKILGLDPVTHKPLEQTENHSNKGQEKNLEVELEVPSVPENTDDTMDLLQGYEMVWGSFNVEPIVNQSNDTSPSFSLDDSSRNLSMGESSSVQEDSQHWGHQLDSSLPWDSFDHLDEFFGFQNHH